MIKTMYTKHCVKGTKKNEEMELCDSNYVRKTLCQRSQGERRKERLFRLYEHYVGLLQNMRRIYICAGTAVF